ncbi:MAG: protease modulator HflC [Deltaproteobacteria bacterium]|nr:protease modulator HflC [Deltaproteobacteria bacterium]
MSKSTNTLIAVLVVIALAAVTLYSCAYTIKQHEQAVILAFGEVVGEPVTDPGLHFKVPWYEARKFDQRWLAWDGDPNQITTLDKRYILIDVFARWKIVDPIVFIEKLRDEESAQGRLDDILDSATRNVIANHNLIEAIRSTNRRFVISDEEKENQLSSVEDEVALLADAPSAVVSPAAALDTDIDALATDNGAATQDSDSDTDSAEAEADSAAQAQAQIASDNREDALAAEEKKISDAADIVAASKDAIERQKNETPNPYQIKVGRQTLTDQIIEKASQKARELGIELKDVRLKRIDYIPSVQESVFRRMVSERTKVASRLRSQGEGLSAKIIGRKERDLKKIQSEAYRKAEEIRGNADATAARIYAEAYQRDPELYRFLKTLESYRQSMGARTTLVITTNSDYGSYLKSAN